MHRFMQGLVRIRYLTYRLRLIHSRRRSLKQGDDTVDVCDNFSLNELSVDGLGLASVPFMLKAPLTQLGTPKGGGAWNCLANLGSSAPHLPIGPLIHLFRKAVFPIGSRPHQGLRAWI